MDSFESVLGSVRENHKSLLSTLQEQLNEAKDEIRVLQDHLRQEERKRMHAEKVVEKTNADMGRLRASFQLAQQEHNAEVKRLFEGMRELHGNLEEAERQKRAAEDKQQIAEKMLATFQARQLGIPVAEHTLLASAAANNGNNNNNSTLTARLGASATTRGMTTRGLSSSAPLPGFASASSDHHSFGATKPVGAASPSPSIGEATRGMQIRAKLREDAENQEKDSELERIKAERNATLERIRNLENAAKEEDATRQAEAQMLAESDNVAQRRRSNLLALQLRAEQETAELTSLRRSLLGSSGNNNSSNGSGSGNGMGGGMNNNYLHHHHNGVSGTISTLGSGPLPASASSSSYHFSTGASATLTTASASFSALAVGPGATIANSNGRLGEHHHRHSTAAHHWADVISGGRD